MLQDQIPMFKKKTFGNIIHRQTIDPVVPKGESSMGSTLPSYMAYLSERYAEKTMKMYWGDVRECSLYLKDKALQNITILDLQQWVGVLLSAQGKHIARKTLNRKVSALLNYFSWLISLGVLIQNPAETLANARIQSPLPDYLYEDEIKTLYQEASKDARAYLIVLLLLETGMKTNELFTLTKSNVDISDSYNPELWIKHTGKEVKKDRKIALPLQFASVYQEYIGKYRIEDILFPITDRAIQFLFVELKKRTKIDKELTPKTLRHTHVVRAYKRGEDRDRIFERIGLAPDSRQEADEVYSKLAGKGI